MQALRTGLSSALGGRGQIAVVSGEAGIGKSAIAAVIAREAAQQAVVTWGRAWEFADAPPYFPMLPCLRTLGMGIDQRQGSPEKRDEERAFHLWETVLGSLVRASEAAARVWILEDLHAADLATLDLLTFLAHPLRAMRVFIVATVRAKDPRITERMMQRLTRLSRDGLDVRLEPLSDLDVAAVTEETLGRAVPESALRRLTELTGGNPLFVVECARAFRNAGGVEGTLGSLPSTVRQVVIDRVALLPDTTRRAIARGAVVGREFSAALLARMDDSLPARVIDAVLPALRAGLVQETKPGQFIFSHTLVRDAIYDALDAEERAAFHGRAEGALAVLGDAADILVERARHALAAVRSGHQAPVPAIADRATDLLEREGAFDRAFELHARIDELRAGGQLLPAAPEKKLHVARIARAAGRSDASRRLCEEVLAAARAARDPELLAEAALLHGMDVRPGIIDRAQVALLEEASAALGESAPGLGCRVRARLATAMQPAMDPSVPIMTARDAVRRARQTGDAAVILDVLDLAAWGVYQAPLEERIAWSTELLQRALAAGDLPKALAAYAWLAFQRLETSDFEMFGRDTESMLALSAEVGHPRHRWRALLLASGRAITLGHFAESDRYVTEVVELAALIDDPAIALSLASHEVLRGRLRRSDPAAQREVIGKVESALSSAWEGELIGATLRASCWARMEDVEATRKELAIIGSRASIIYADLTLSAYLAEAYALAGTDDQRRDVRDVLRRMEAKEISGDQVTFIYEGTLGRVLGVLDASLGDLESGEEKLRDARALAIERRHAPWAAQITYELANVVKQRGGRDDEARHLMEECARMAHDLGMTELERRASTNGEGEVNARSVAVTLRQEGDVWRIERGGLVVRIRDSRGIRLLSKLVERPDEEIHVLALASDDGTNISESSAGDLIDDQARHAYRRRLGDLETEIAAAESRADAGRSAELEREMEALKRELARATGLGGRIRQGKSVTERARVNVQKRMKEAVARITEADQGLGLFFEHAVCTGTFCCFRP